ncbi:helix-turn-helix domain-containing protein [Flavobacterium silvaticum]|uniref:Helix-turn-helix transcriptional regulator n=1 Tax=Flavobacterium silvaticum TaxID=1852020 RepID=A0A972JJE6_9FLAO|nr:helix-turn-helix transcriptional regulator [Flavobacterium silvaticum]NMH28137.1 helix-turn-helix transcriptional regulator [Flavobacterium silvaticum]
MKKQVIPYHIKSVQELLGFWGRPKPRHPLISVFLLCEAAVQDTLPEYHTYGFYCIAIKKNFGGKVKYGQRYYDFDSGVMSFVSPNQMLSHLKNEAVPNEGIVLVFHPDFLLGHPLAKNIKKYGFFSYELSEALHLSEQEENTVETLMKNIETEYNSNIDIFSQDVIIAQIELLLQFSNRFYNRQFITRKPANDDILVRLENVLAISFEPDRISENGLPTVQYISEQLHVSPNYLSDMLRTITGQSTQQYVHDKLLEKAKELLTTTNLSVKEIAFQLGFDYPQSFNKLFKNKMQVSPLEFRQSFN